MNIPEQIGNYTLDREIGSGASSQVWLAHHTRLPEHFVAIKVLMSQDREAIRRFQREASIAARLRHPHIVQLYDYGYSQPFFYTVLEYVPGSSLRQIIEKQGRLQIDATLQIFRQVADALDYAHSLGVVHRDVSPGNILIGQQSGRALLTDFGIARDNGKSITIAKTIMGTPGFLSPEHIQGSRAVTHLSDLFSLGVVLYHMLSGDMPWEETPGISENPGFSPPIPLRQRGAENLPGDIDRVIRTMLALDPARRFASARAAVDEIDRIFSRHQMATQIVVGSSDAAHIPVDFQSSGIAPNDVETVLGPELLRAPIDRAHRRAEELRNPAQIELILNVWANQSKFGLRRKLIGRLANLHKVSSQNIYFYHLRVLYEQRSPAADEEEPDHSAEPFALVPEMDRWEYKLPTITDFSDHTGEQVILPGSTRVVTCKTCNGIGMTVCPECRGKQRVLVTRPVLSPTTTNAATATASIASSSVGGARITSGQSRSRTTATDSTKTRAPLPSRTEQVLVPCPTCAGRGGITCTRCEGVSRLIQRKTFRWRRYSTRYHSHDKRPALNEHWLQRTCKEEEIYRERHIGGFRPEWSMIDTLAPLLTQAQARTDANTQIALSEVTVSFIPVTDILCDFGKPGDKGIYKLTIYGFKNMIPSDWRFFNWERVITILLVTFSILVSFSFVYVTFF
ncbi:MAG: protein kinase [Oscillochloris sp.]|nr:protein kinase [Oscillochloris sp.]